MNPFVGDGAEDPAEVGAAHDHGRVYAHPADRDDEGRDVQARIHTGFEGGLFVHRDAGLDGDVGGLFDAFARGDDERHGQWRGVIPDAGQGLSCGGESDLREDDADLFLKDGFRQRRKAGLPFI